MRGMDFDKFYRDTSRRLLRYAYGLTGDAGEAQDLVQEAYARAWQRRRRLAGYDDPEAWLRLVVNRLATDRWRHLGVRRKRAAAAAPPDPGSPGCPAAGPPWPPGWATPANRKEPVMSVDLDELFDAVRQQADTIPLAGPGVARAHGRHRTQVRATVTAAVVITLVVVGVGVAFRPAAQHRDSADHHDPRPIPVVGEPVGMNGNVVDAAIDTDGTRVYAAEADRTGDTSWLAAVNLRDGSSAWNIKGLWIHEKVRPVRIIATPSTVLVFVEAGPVIHVLGFAPATGKMKWNLAVDDLDDVIVAGDRVISLQRSTGEVRINDVATGKLKGRDDDRNVRVLGWGTPADDDRVDLSSSSAPVVFADSRVVIVDSAGNAKVRDTETGGLLRNVSLGSAPGAAVRVYDGLLFTNRPGDPLTATAGQVHLRAADLTGSGGGSWTVGTVPGGADADRFAPCGTGRFCVLSSGPDAHSACSPPSTSARGARPGRSPRTCRTVISRRPTGGCW